MAMVNKFLLVGFSGLAICIACLSASALIGGKALSDTGFDFADLGWARCDFNESGKPGSRNIAWTGGDKAGIDIPATVHYRRGSGDQLVVKGDSEVISHVRIVDGDVKMDCRMRHGSDRLDVTLPGREFRTFALAGSGSLSLDDIDQTDLRIRLAGSGDVEATGKTGNLDLKMAGSGDAKLGAVAADRIKLELAGSNDAEVSPKDDLDVDIAGSGKVVLLTEPHALETHIAGSGRIVHPDLDKGI
jgi:Putative auto-transporter adhesin, head GIN domain